MTNGVNGVSVVLPNLFEGALRQLREGLHRLSDTRFPGLRARHYRLLSFLPDDGIRLSRLADLTGLTKQALAQALEPLAADGYVVVTEDPGDRRARIVRRTARGREVLDAVHELQEEYELIWSSEVGAERWVAARQVLIELFGRLPPGFRG